MPSQANAGAPLLIIAIAAEKHIILMRLVLRRLLRCEMSFADFSATIVLGSTFEIFKFRGIGILCSLLSLM